MISKKYIIGLILIILITCTMVSAVDAVSAAKYKKMDSGKATIQKDILSKWTTYYNGKTVKVNWKIYIKNSASKRYVTYNKATINFKKVSKTKLKGNIVTHKTNYIKYSKKPLVDNTKLTAKKYYYKEIKPILKKG